MKELVVVAGKVVVSVFDQTVAVAVVVLVDS